MNETERREWLSNLKYGDQVENENYKVIEFNDPIEYEYVEW